MQVDENIKTLEQLALTLAHEVKSPLSIVRANIDILEKVDMEAKHIKNYEVIYRGLDKINSIMMDFLQLLKSPSTSHDVVYIDELLREIISDYDFGRDISFDLKMEEDIYFLGDEKELKIVFNNLIKNAVEAILAKGDDEEDGVISITASREGGMASILIEDNGIGISEETLRRIEKEYYTTKKTGNGLGVHICKKIIKEHNGTFNIASTENGCIVTIKLPIYKAC